MLPAREERVHTARAPLPWSRGNALLDAIGRRPVLVVWCGLNLALVTWWRGFEPLADAERLRHQAVFLWLVNLLDWPGLWATSAWLHLVEILAALVHGRDSMGMALGQRGVLIVWLLSMAVTWAFWRFVAAPMVRRFDRWVASRRDPYLG